MKRTTTIKGVIEDRWYGIRYQDESGKWHYEEPITTDEKKRDARRLMNQVDFMGHKVQMVEHFHGFRPIGKIKDFRF